VTPPTCLKEPFSRLPSHHAYSAALDHLIRWADGGAAPPPAPRIKRAADGVTLARDVEGFVIGGIRLPALAVPLAINRGDNVGAGFCFLYGSYEPYDEVTLLQMYPSRADYVRKMYAATIESFRAGFLLATDAKSTCREARLVNLGWENSAARLPGKLKKCAVE
jgi:hypothetical protein